MDLIHDEFQSDIYTFGLNIWLQLGISSQTAHILNSLLLVCLLFLMLYVLDYILRRVFMLILIKNIRRSRTKLDDYFIRNGVLKNAIHLVPIFIAKQATPFIFTGFPKLTTTILKITDVLIIVAFTFLLRSLIRSFKDYLKSKKRFADKPLDSYFQVVSIILYIICGVIIITHLLGIPFLTILGGFGAASAIILLVFKDTILGFVASIQVSTNDMVRVGDWIEMTKYGADGTVLEINLSTVKVQNFDKTITTIPTYALISDSFRNYRGMQRSGGRRIKRSVHLKLGAIRFLEADEIENLKRIKLLKSYIIERQQEIAEYNRTHVDDPTMLVNGRRMTNIGLFREYVKRYLLNNPNTHKQYYIMVRHLQPTAQGLPLEIYTFANTTEWIKYEGIMADIFDHILAVVPYFHLELFELPSSTDFNDFLIAQQNTNKTQPE